MDYTKYTKLQLDACKDDVIQVLIDPDVEMTQEQLAKHFGVDWYDRWKFSVSGSPWEWS